MISCLLCCVTKHFRAVICYKTNKKVFTLLVLNCVICAWNGYVFILVYIRSAESALKNISVYFTALTLMSFTDINMYAVQKAFASMDSIHNQ